MPLHHVPLRPQDWRLGPAISAPGCKGEIMVGGRLFVIAGDRSVPSANLACYVSDDLGEHWQKQGSVLVDPIAGTDLGDGNLVGLPDGRLLAVYRRNHFRDEFNQSPEYGVHVSESSDGGKTWKLHSMVSQHRIDQVGVSRGYWAPFLFVTKSGALQCYYDDEYTPYQAGFKGHQWVEMKQWNAKKMAWGPGITVSRAPNPKELSRDGMATVVEPRPGKLVCTLESVSTTSPVVGNVRVVFSEDEGRSWSWKKGVRPVAYQAAGPYHSFSPWSLLGPDGSIYCLFATDEDNNEPKRAGTPAHLVRLDIKMLVSKDQGRTWQKQPKPIDATSHRDYLPSGCSIGDGQALVSWLDFTRGPLMAKLKF
jgi:hypothetical protein